MKIALISDIHGNIPALEAVYQSVREKGVSKIYNLGDSFYGPLWPEETARFLIKNNIPAIMGNEDEALINNKVKNETEKYTLSQLSESSINWLKTLPGIYQNKNITLFHGSPGDNRKYFLEKIYRGRIVIKDEKELAESVKNIKTRYIGFGHSHLERVMVLKDKILINAGSVGWPAFSDDSPVHNIETFNNFARYAIIDNQNVELCNIAYDFKLACKRAKKNGRDDWAFYLMHGRV